MHVKLVLPRRSQFDACRSNYAELCSEVEQDGQFLLFGENTVEVHTMSLVACEETSRLDLTLRVKAACEGRLPG